MLQLSKACSCNASMISIDSVVCSSLEDLSQRYEEFPCQSQPCDPSKRVENE